MLKMDEFLRDQAGPTMAEYALIAALVAIAAIAAFTYLGGTIGNRVNEVGANIAGS